MKKRVFEKIGKTLKMTEKPLDMRKEKDTHGHVCVHLTKLSNFIRGLVFEPEATIVAGQASRYTYHTQKQKFSTNNLVSLLVLTK